MKIFHTNIYLHTNTLKFVKRVSTPVALWLDIVSLLWICMHTFGKIKLLKFSIFENNTPPQKKEKPSETKTKNPDTKALSFWREKKSKVCVGESIKYFGYL